MSDFDMSRFDEYREGNRLEVKKAKKDYLIRFGILTLLFQIVMVG